MPREQSHALQIICPLVSVVDYGINAQNASNFIATKPKEVETFAIQRFAELEKVKYLTMAETGEIFDLAGIKINTLQT